MRALHAVPALLCATVLASARPANAQLSLRFDYSGAEAILAALERDSLSAAAVDSLVKLPAVRDMIRVTTGFSPASSLEGFREDVRYFARHKRSRPGADGNWRIAEVWQLRAQIRALLDRIRSDEKKVVTETVEALGPFQPKGEALEVTVYFYAGGNSGGGPLGTNGLYANLQQSDGDFGAVVMNIAHEVFHVMQNVAWSRRPESAAYANGRDRLPSSERLLVETLAEGTANFAADPTRWTGTQRATRESHERYERNRTPERIRENFALFETLLRELAAGATTWRNAYDRGFTSNAGSRDPRMYFVGYEMARAIHADCGSECVGALFEKPAIEFYRQYIAAYRANPELVGRFSPETERYLLGLGPLPPPPARAGRRAMTVAAIGLVAGLAYAMVALRRRSRAGRA